jgi:hypothetical protein
MVTRHYRLGEEVAGDLTTRPRNRLPCSSAFAAGFGDHQMRAYAYSSLTVAYERSRASPGPMPMGAAFSDSLSFKRRGQGNA